MTPDDITTVLQQRFGSGIVESGPGSWQVEMPQFRLLILLSADQSWLRALIPISQAAEVAALHVSLLEANFDLTLETRYALHQDVLWGVFHHGLASLSREGFTLALEQLLALQEQGLAPLFSQLIETRLRQIIRVAKQQGQTMGETLQVLARFYEEGVMGDLRQGTRSRDEVLATWRSQLERLWPQVEGEP